MTDFDDILNKMIDPRLGALVKPALGNIMNDMFAAMKREIYMVMDELGEPRDEYHINIHPFTLERVDGEPVPEHLLKAIGEKLQPNQ